MKLNKNEHEMSNDVEVKGFGTDQHWRISLQNMKYPPMLTRTPIPPVLQPLQPVDPFGHSRPELVVCSLGRTKLQQLDVDVATGTMSSPPPFFYNDVTRDVGDLVTGM